MKARAEQIAKEARRPTAPGDFVDRRRRELPLQAIAELLGVPQEDRDKLFRWSNEMIADDDPEYAGDPDESSFELISYAMTMAEDAEPTRATTSSPSSSRPTSTGTSSPTTSSASS